MGTKVKRFQFYLIYKQRKKRNLISRLLKFVIIMFELEFSLETAK